MAEENKLPSIEYSGAKQTILKMLWDGGWVLSDDILEAVGQSYYDRRIRELREEDGWEIEVSFQPNRDGKKRPAYRLTNHKRTRGIKRLAVSVADKQFVLKRDNYTCQLCGISLIGGANNPQIDHKVPLLREGPHERKNFQAICSNCNVVKRGVCKKCTLLTCDNCYLAYPEKGANNMLFSLTDEESKRLAQIAEQFGVARIEALRILLNSY